MVRMPSLSFFSEEKIHDISWAFFFYASGLQRMQLCILHLTLLWTVARLMQFLLSAPAMASSVPHRPASCSVRAALVSYHWLIETVLFCHTLQLSGFSLKKLQSLVNCIATNDPEKHIFIQNQLCHLSTRLKHFCLVNSHLLRQAKWTKVTMWKSGQNPQTVTMSGTGCIWSSVFSHSSACLFKCKYLSFLRVVQLSMDTSSGTIKLDPRCSQHNEVWSNEVSCWSSPSFQQQPKAAIIPTSLQSLH